MQYSLEIPLNSTEKIFQWKFPLELSENLWKSTNVQKQITQLSLFYICYIGFPVHVHVHMLMKILSKCW